MLDTDRYLSSRTNLRSISVAENRDEIALRLARF